MEHPKGMNGFVFVRALVVPQGDSGIQEIPLLERSAYNNIGWIRNSVLRR